MKKNNTLSSNCSFTSYRNTEGQQILGNLWILLSENVFKANCFKRSQKSIQNIYILVCFQVHCYHVSNIFKFIVVMKQTYDSSWKKKEKYIMNQLKQLFLKFNTLVLFEIQVQNCLIWIIAGGSRNWLSSSSTEKGGSSNVFRMIWTNFILNDKKNNFVKEIANTALFKIYQQQCLLFITHVEVPILLTLVRLLII